MSVGPFVVLLAALPAGPVTPSAPALASTDEQVLKAANIAVAGPALLDFLHKRSGAAADKAEIAGLVKQLADAGKRDAAAARLVAAGEPAVPLLREAANNLDDPEFAGRARRCLDGIEGPQAAGLSIAIVRAVAALKPDGAGDALLEYLPFADDGKVAEEVETALAAVALRDGKPESAVARALTDPTPARRAAAAVALCRVGGDEGKTAVRGLLKDPKPTVRFRAALALAEAYDTDAVPVIIDLLADLPNEQRKQAEEYLVTLAGDWAVTGPQGNDATSRKLRRDAWAAWWKGIDDKVLLDEFQSRTMSDDEREQALGLIQKLDDVSADMREKASTGLVGMGLRVTPLLRQAVAGANPRIAPYAQKCLELIEKDAPNPLPAAAGRMLALRAPDGAVGVLLAYLPYADSDQSSDQLRDLLGGLAIHDPKAAPVLLKALDDRLGVRRGAAAVALVRRGGGDDLEAVKHKMFKDPDADVRLRAALAVLTVAHDKDAVPVLISLLPELPTDKVWQAEEVLALLAGDKAPSVSASGDAEARKKARDAWASWWADNNAAIDVAKLDLNEGRELGYLLVTEMNAPNRPTGRVFELDAAGKVRWEIDNLISPQDAQATSGNRVVIVDNGGARVCERETTGDKKVLWEKNVPNAFRVQRLPNGNTFVACRNSLMEFDRSGKEVLNLARPNEWLLDAQKMRDGQMVLLNNQGGCTRLDAGGKELKSFHVPFNPNFGINGAQVLPNDHTLIASWNSGKVTEYDADGKMVFDANVQQANNCCRLPNGHTLVTCQNLTHIVELDQTGKVVNDMKDLPYHPWRASRR